MELKEFIQQTLVQITEGIREGHKYITENNFGEGVSDSHGKEINFDIAVATNEDKTTGLSGKVSVANIFSAGGKDENVTKASNVSRIQFKLVLFVKAGESSHFR
jgi:hypothetical protein